MKQELPGRIDTFAEIVRATPPKQALKKGNRPAAARETNLIAFVDQ
jgi:hypothetical protein